MTTLVNTPEDFAAESLAAFCEANAHLVAHVPGGAVRRGSAPGRVTVVMGGGSGHHPAFAGWVGQGLGDAAVCGNVFSSPSEHQILGVARAADQGGGILFVPINYSGDILHFGAAMQVLRGEGKDARLVAVTDDIASGTPASSQDRRGIAGSLIVMKVAGAAAARGWPLDEVERIAVAANEATRSFGVAFSGCTLPGAEHPLFEVPEGRAAVGMGIHGEPGISEIAFGTAREMADVLVDGLLEERPARAGQRVALVVNGLGATKYDELHLVHARVTERLAAEGMPVVAPLVGEYMTSLDMAGLSVSICPLDDELEALWCDPVESAALTRPRIHPAPAEAGTGAPARPEETPQRAVLPGSEESQAAAGRLVRALDAVIAGLEAEQDELGRLDAVAGDGDHGAGMVVGARAARVAAREAHALGAGAGTVLRVAGELWSATAGGTSGALWGAGLKAAGAVIGDERAVEGEIVCAAVEAFAEAVMARGAAEVGDKTMVDAIVPFASALSEHVHAGVTLQTAWRSAAVSSSRAAVATAQLSSRRGRSRTHGERSVGTPDPGATSFALVVGVLARMPAPAVRA
ncbi:dihydroxyacetone kinase family protein [Microbacterium tumbae]